MDSSPGESRVRRPRGGPRARRPRLGALAVLLCAAAVFVACSRSGSGRGRGVLVIAVDALRYDHLDCNGYDRPTAPTMTRLANQGVRFTNAYSAAPRQIPAHMALLSSSDPRLARRLLPPDVQVRQAALWHWPDDLPHPAASFLSQGFATAAFYDHDNLAPVYGYSLGFSLYQGPERDEATGENQTGSEHVFRRFQQWLRGTPRGQDWFAYLEVADLERVWGREDPQYDRRFVPRPELDFVPPIGAAPHLFFAVPFPRAAAGLSTLGEYEARYDGAIRRLDEALGKLLGELGSSGRLEETTVVIVGAYGVGFGEGGLLLDSGTFSDSDLHVPLIVRPAGSITQNGVPALVGARSEALVSTIDLLPTLMKLSQVDAEAGQEGILFADALFDPGFVGRKHVHASSGFQEGYAVISRDGCYEYVFPGRGVDARQSASWFGDVGLRPDVLRESYHDRSVDSGLDHLHAGPADSDSARALAAAGAISSAKIEARRARLQGNVFLRASRPAER